MPFWTHQLNETATLKTSSLSNSGQPSYSSGTEIDIAKKVDVREIQTDTGTEIDERTIVVSDSEMNKGDKLVFSDGGELEINFVENQDHLPSGETYYVAEG